MLGGVEDLVGLGQFHDTADVHHRHAIADVSHDTEVVRDEEIRQPKVSLQVEQEIQDLGLHRDIQGRDRLVRDHQSGMQSQCPRDADALTLAAAEGMGEPPHVLGAEPDPAQEVRHAVFALPSALHAVDEQRLADEVE